MKIQFPKDVFDFIRKQSSHNLECKFNKNGYLAGCQAWVASACTKVQP